MCGVRLPFALSGWNVTDPVISGVPLTVTLPTTGTSFSLLPLPQPKNPAQNTHAEATTTANGPLTTDKSRLQGSFATFGGGQVTIDLRGNSILNEPDRAIGIAELDSGGMPAAE